MAKAKIKKRGCLGAFLWLCLGFTLGVGAAASWAVFINKLYIPFTETPTRTPTSARKNLALIRRAKPWSFTKPSNGNRQHRWWKKTMKRRKTKKRRAVLFTICNWALLSTRRR